MRTRRALFAVIFLSCASALAYAYYIQFYQYLDPCPLCIFQRIGFFLLGGICLIAALQGPKKFGARVYGVLGMLASGFGIAIAGRHVWLQTLPPDQVPDCGPGLGYMLDAFPMAEIIKKVLTGSGECANVDWQFLGLSMPVWSLICFLLLTSLLIFTAFIKKDS